MQLSDIRNEVTSRLGISTTDQFFTPTVLNLLINASLRRVTSAWDWDWNEASDSVAMTAGNDVINIPTAAKIRWASYEDREVRFRNFRDSVHYNNVTGKPAWYTEDSKVFRILPTPDTDYTLEVGYFVETDGPLVADSDEPRIPDSAIDLLIADVGVLISRRQRDRELEMVFFAEYRNTLERLMDSQIQTQEGMLPRRTRN